MRMRRDMIAVKPRGGRSFRRDQGRRRSPSASIAVLAWFRGQVHAHGGGNYHTLLNDALRNDIAEEDELDLL
jgi:hypothetical protein